MNNDRRYEIKGKIVSVSQIEEVAEYLLKTKDNYVRLIEEDKVKNNDAYFDNGQYSYFAYSQPKVTFDIKYLDGRSVETNDEYVFKDALREPQYLKSINMQIYIAYRSNIEGEETSHNMSLYLTFNDDMIYFSTSDKNMNDQSYNLNSYVRSIIEKGPDNYDSVAKNRNFYKLIIGTGIGTIFTFIFFLLSLLLKAQGSEVVINLYKTSFILVLFGWVIAVGLGNFFSNFFIGNLFYEIDKTLNSSYKDIAKRKTERYKESNQILIGENCNNLEKRETIKKLFNISKYFVLGHLVFSVLFIIFTI